jgi:hypothetical protein
VPDLVFMEAWYIAAASKMDRFQPGALALGFQALGLLKPGEGVPGAVSERFLRVALERGKEVMVGFRSEELGQVLWGLADLRWWPGDEWMRVWMEGEGAEAGWPGIGWICLFVTRLEASVLQ